MKKQTFLLIALLLEASSIFAQPVLKSVSSINEYSIVYELYGGTNASTNKDSYLEYETVELAAPTRSGYSFDGWYWDEGLKTPVTGNTFSNKKGALKVYAKWLKQIDFTVFENENMVEIIPVGSKVTLEDFAGTSGPQDIFAYSIGKYEVTQELYQAVMGTNPSEFKGEKLPVETVTWYDAVYFCNELTKLTMEAENCCYTITNIEKDDEGHITWANVTWNQSKKGYRLPTEAEWEMAARGGIKGGWDYKYSGSDDIDQVAWYYWNTYDYRTGERSTKTVGTMQPNKAGLYDMSGNVWEWCWNTWSEGSSNRVNRGGGWYYDIYNCTVSDRYGDQPGFKRSTLGFRVCRGL